MTPSPIAGQCRQAAPGPCFSFTALGRWAAQTSTIKKCLENGIVGGDLLSATASFAGSGIEYHLYLKLETTGAGDTVTGSRDSASFISAQNTALLPESSSWAIDLGSGQAFDMSSGRFSPPVSFQDSVRTGFFNIVTFTDPTHLMLDVRQDASLGFVPAGGAADDTSSRVNVRLVVNSSGTAYTNPVAGVPEPKTCALLLAGLAGLVGLGALAGLGAAAKRRKAK